jgi:hypothetical protein
VKQAKVTNHTQAARVLAAGAARAACTLIMHI